MFLGHQLMMIITDGKSKHRKKKDGIGSIKELMMKKGKLAENVLKMAGKSRSLAWNLAYEATMNTLFANSGAGKTKIAVTIAIYIAINHPEKFIYYYAPDLSMDDLLEMRALVKKYELEENLYY